MQRRCLYIVICLLLLGTTALSGASPAVQAVQAEAQGLVLSLTVESREISIGHPVTAVLELRNNRPAPVTLIVAEGAFDLVVYNAGGSSQWAWTQSRSFPLIPPERRIVPPGGTVTATLVWDQTILRAPLQVVGKAAPSTYYLQGVLHATLLDAPRLQLRTPRIAIAVRP